MILVPKLVHKPHLLIHLLQIYRRTTPLKLETHVKAVEDHVTHDPLHCARLRSMPGLAFREFGSVKLEPGPSLIESTGFRAGRWRTF